MKLYINNVEIKFTTLEWRGSKYNAARQITASYPSDLPYKFKQGDIVHLKNGNTTYFKGYVFRVEKSYKSNEFSVVAYDPMIYLLNSRGSFNYKTISIDEYIKNVAASVGITVGSLADSGTMIKLDPQININLYEAILEGYTQVKNKTNKIYTPTIENEKLNVKVAGEVVKDLTLENKVNLLNSIYSETIENVINKVIIVDDKGNKVGQVTGEGLNTWGTFQSVYEGDNTTEAKNLLHGMDKEVLIEALGDTRCISGKAVTIKDLETGLNGLFYIDEDTHIWQGNNYTMNLVLNYKNEMEES